MKSHLKLPELHEPAWSHQQFEAELRALGRFYHIHHPYQVAMHEGKLNQVQMQGWVANRFYYQISIPRKDAAILANCPDRAIRRQWIQRILDHDGYHEDESEGGIEVWSRLGEAVGLERDALWSQQLVLPGVKFAVDAYSNFARNAPWQEAICSSLTELFAPTIHRQRLDDWPEKYPWIEASGLDYFRNRLGQAHRDVQHGLAETLRLFDSRDKQNRAMEIVFFKLQVLWTMLDAMHMAYMNDMPPFFNVEQAP